MLQSIECLFKSFNDNKISYCHWKSSNHLEASMDGLTDLDVLVDDEMAQKATELIIEQGFERFETVHLRSYPGILDYVCLDESGVWAHLHLHFKLILGDRWVKAYRLPVEKEFLSRAQFEEQFNSYVINSHDELLLLILLVKIILRKEKVYIRC